MAWHVIAGICLGAIGLAALVYAVLGGIGWFIERAADEFEAEEVD